MKVSFTINYKQFESVIPFVRRLPDETDQVMECCFKKICEDRGIKNEMFPSQEENAAWMKAWDDAKKVGFEYVIPEIGIVLRDVTFVKTVEYEYSPTFVFHSEIPRPEWIKITLTYDKATA